MNEGIQIQLNRDRLNPGEKLAGQACWQLAKAPRTVAIRLFWKTSGKGTEDVGLVDERRVEASDQQQGADFCFQLPIEPYSYEGHLVSITWGVEVLAGKVSAVQTFVMAPEGAARRSNARDLDP